MPLGFGPISSGPISEVLDAQAAQTTVRNVYFASRPFVTRASDAPAHEYIPGRITAGLQLSRRLTQADAGQFGASIEVNFGEMQLNNNDGALDYLVNRYAADGREVRLLIGAMETDAQGIERVQPLASFATAYTTVAGNWTFEHDLVRLSIESLTNRLGNRLQQQTYVGDGGEEGTADLAGLSKPAAFGRCLNVAGQIVDPALLTYQFHAGAMELFGAVYDAGIDVPFGADYPSYAALAAATVDPGTYASSLAAGFIRLGSIPIGAITADVRGHKDLDTGSYVETTADIIRTVLRDYGAITTSLIDHASFNAMNDVQSGDIGIFLEAGNQSTVLELIESVAFGAGAFVGQDRSGLFRIQRLEPPSETAVHWAFTDRDLRAIERLTLPYGVPWRSWGVGYAVNWTVQGDADLALSVTQARRQFLQSERRYAFVSSPSIALFHATSSGAPLRDSFFIDQAVAAAEAERLQALYGYGRTLYRLVVKNALLSVEIGQTIMITYRRWDLASGKRFIVVGIEDDADRIETALTVFG